jgi:hypothetical protein
MEYGFRAGSGEAALAVSLRLDDETGGSVCIERLITVSLPHQLNLLGTYGPDAVCRLLPYKGQDRVLGPSRNGIARLGGVHSVGA